MATKNILVGLDHSDCAHHVAEEAIELALKSGSSLVLLHVLNLPQGLDPAAPITPVEGGPTLSAEAHLRNESAARLSSFAQSARARGVDCQERVKMGDPAAVLLEQAEACDAAQIVMGSHGRKGLSRWLLGSVSERVTRKANCPVVAVPSVHRPDCEARSCNWCDTDRTAAICQVDAEMEG